VPSGPLGDFTRGENYSQQNAATLALNPNYVNVQDISVGSYRLILNDFGTTFRTLSQD
jgi:hypothetical protein